MRSFLHIQVSTSSGVDRAKSDSARRKADSGRAYVTQPNGKVESGRRFAVGRGAPNPKPGSTVFVPEKDPADKKDYVAATAAVAQILASLVAIIVVLRR